MDGPIIKIQMIIASIRNEFRDLEVWIMTFVEKLGANYLRREQPYLLSISVPELGLMAVRPDLVYREVFVYRGDRFVKRLDMGPGDVAESFRKAMRDYVESL